MISQLTQERQEKYSNHFSLNKTLNDIEKSMYYIKSDSKSKTTTTERT